MKRELNSSQEYPLTFYSEAPECVFVYISNGNSMFRNTWVYLITDVSCVCLWCAHLHAHVSFSVALHFNF